MPAKEQEAVVRTARFYGAEVSLEIWPNGANTYPADAVVVAAEPALRYNDRLWNGNHVMAGYPKLLKEELETRYPDGAPARGTAYFTRNHGGYAESDLFLNVWIHAVEPNYIDRYIHKPTSPAYRAVGEEFERMHTIALNQANAVQYETKEGETPRIVTSIAIPVLGNGPVEGEIVVGTPIRKQMPSATERAELAVKGVHTHLDQLLPSGSTSIRKVVFVLQTRDVAREYINAFDKYFEGSYTPQPSIPIYSPEATPISTPVPPSPQAHTPGTSVASTRENTPFIREPTPVSPASTPSFLYEEHEYPPEPTPPRDPTPSPQDSTYAPRQPTPQPRSPTPVLREPTPVDDEPIPYGDDPPPIAPQHPPSTEAPLQAPTPAVSEPTSDFWLPSPSPGDFAYRRSREASRTASPPAALEQAGLPLSPSSPREKTSPPRARTHTPPSPPTPPPAKRVSQTSPSHCREVYKPKGQSPIPGLGNLPSFTPVNRPAVAVPTTSTKHTPIPVASELVTSIEQPPIPGLGVQREPSSITPSPSTPYKLPTEPTPTPEILEAPTPRETTPLPDVSAATTPRERTPLPTLQASTPVPPPAGQLPVICQYFIVKEQRGCKGKRWKDSNSRCYAHRNTVKFA